jgi:SagB-type dehydrogenase family enzyme
VRNILSVGLVASDTESQSTHRLEIERRRRADAPNVNAVLRLGSRVYLEASGELVIKHDAVSVTMNSWRGGNTVTRLERELAFSGHLEPVWMVLKLMDGKTGEPAIAAACPGAQAILDLLITYGLAVDGSRQVAAFVHNATKKGYFPTAGLTSSEIAALRPAVAASYQLDRVGASIESECPAGLKWLFDLTGCRRSPARFGGSITASELAWLLASAAGETEVIQTGRGSVVRRAYPSSGGLYAVLIDVIAFDVEGLAVGTYRYRAHGNQLCFVGAVKGLQDLLDIAVPEQHRYVAGAAALVSMSADLTRHERKYGVGGYRMVVAEAGHLSQNLLLAAEAMGLRGRPCGGFFDDLLGALLRRDTDTEPFVLGVLIGRGSTLRETADPAL